MLKNKLLHERLAAIGSTAGKNVNFEFIYFDKKLIIEVVISSFQIRTGSQQFPYLSKERYSHDKKFLQERVALLEKETR